MAQNNAPQDVDPKMLEDSQNFWVTFMNITKNSVIAIVILLALMAFFLV